MTESNRKHWQGIIGIATRAITLARRYQLTLTSGAALVALWLISSWILIQLAVTSMEKAGAIRGAFVERDLRDLINRLDADERFTLDHNLEKLIAERRPLTPLLLPHQYYVARPSGNLSPFPRQPPRNCFVTLLAKGSTPDPLTTGDKICPYFLQNKALGKYMYFAATIHDQSIVPLKRGDVSLRADSLRLSLRNGNATAVWWLVLQSPSSAPQKGRYEITAFREVGNNIKERDKRVEGWAYTQRQTDGTQFIYFVSRIDVKEFYQISATSNADSDWPPLGWQHLELSVERNDVSENSGQIRRMFYEATGTTNLSLVSLADSIHNSHAKLDIKRSTGKSEVSFNVPPQTSAPSNFKMGPMEILDGDLLLATREHVRSRILPDTGLTFYVTQPGNVVEKGVWQALVGLGVLVIVGIFVAMYFFKNLLRPIFTLTRQSRYLIHDVNKGTSQLPYASQVNEIGTLARGFNELLNETRLRTAQENLQRGERQAAENQRKLEEIKIRESNVNVIGHEIRSPLQALVSLHLPNSETRKYVDRIIASLPHLQGSMGPETAFENRPMALEREDLAAFAAEVAANARLQAITHVRYLGPQEGMFVEVDDGAIEDAVMHILHNANKFRTIGTFITLDVVAEGENIVLSIANIGSGVDEDIIEEIFDYGFTTTSNNSKSGTGQGLFVAKIYVSRMNGSIRAVNIPDGARFDIILPRAAMGPE